MKNGEMLAQRDATVRGSGDESRPEQLVIRPPSEWRSILVRATRGCKWNRCLFCGIYPGLGEPVFSVRPLDEIKRDILLLKARTRLVGGTAFVGDSDPLQIGVENFAEIANRIRAAFPRLKRLTCYARASTLWKIGEPGIRRLAEAGLNRVHVGLETGDPELLKYHRKGQSPKTVIESAEWLKRAGIEMSCYVLLGLGGADKWRQHADNTAVVLNKANPEFVRIRRIWIYKSDRDGGPECPLWPEIRAGRFIPQSPEGTALELRRLIEGLNGIASFITCDHANNYIRIEGRMPQDKAAMMEAVDVFLSLPASERQRRYLETGSQL